MAKTMPPKTGGTLSLLSAFRGIHAQAAPLRLRGRGLEDGATMAGQQHPASLLLRGENGLRNHAVDPLGAIDHLGDVIIHPTRA